MVTQIESGWLTIMSEENENQEEYIDGVVVFDADASFDRAMEGGVVYNGNVRWDTTKPKLPLMDRKYPHVCYECGKGLSYMHAYIEASRKELGIRLRDHILVSSLDKKGIIHIMGEIEKVNQFKRQFRKMWKSSYFKFFCCDCFKKENIQSHYFEDIEK